MRVVLLSPATPLTPAPMHMASGYYGLRANTNDEGNYNTATGHAEFVAIVGAVWFHWTRFGTLPGRNFLLIG
jgi:hypothetical protein